MKRYILLFVCLCSIIDISAQTYERDKPSFVTIQHRICFYGRYEIAKDGLYQYKKYEDNVLSHLIMYNNHWAKQHYLHIFYIGTIHL